MNYANPHTNIRYECLMARTNLCNINFSWYKQYLKIQRIYPTTQFFFTSGQTFNMNFEVAILLNTLNLIKGASGKLKRIHNAKTNGLYWNNYYRLSCVFTTLLKALVSINSFRIIMLHHTKEIRREIIMVRI